MEIEKKSFSFEVKNVDEGESQFEGSSAAIGNEDLGRDVIEAGAFKKTIQERVSSGSVKLLDNHSKSSTKNVWGTVRDAEERAVEASGPDDPTHKLWTLFEVSKSDQDAQTALAKIKEGHLNQLSIGYRPIKVDYKVDDDSDLNEDPFYAWLVGEATRFIKELAWWETSLVIWGMNPEATIVENSVKTIQHFAEICKRNKQQVPQKYVEAAAKAMNSLIELDIDPSQFNKVESVIDKLKKHTDNLQNVEKDIFTQLINEYKDSQDNPSREDFFMWVGRELASHDGLKFETEALPEGEDLDDDSEKEEEASAPISEDTNDQPDAKEDEDEEDGVDLRAISDRLTELAETIQGLVTNQDEDEEDQEDEDGKEAAESTSEEAADSTSEEDSEPEDNASKSSNENLKAALEEADAELSFINLT